MFKASQYNCFISHLDKIVYFNTLSKKNFIISDTEHSELQQMFADPISFSLENPTRFQRLKSWGFFIDSETSELSIIRYRYYKSVFTSTFHIVINNSLICGISNEFIKSLKALINNVSQDLPIKSICLEWKGIGILEYFDEYILQTVVYAQQVCQARGLNLINQIEIRTSNSVKLHDKLYNNKGKSTYKKTFEYLHKIDCNIFTIKLHIQAIPFNKSDILPFISQFPNKDNIYLIWEDYSKQSSIQSVINNHAKIEKLKYTQSSIHLNSDIWIENVTPSPNSINIYPNGNIYMVPVANELLLNYKESSFVGKLIQNGDITWDIDNKEKILSEQPWFENPRCISCKYLPIFMERCINYKVNNKTIICPLTNNIIDPNSIIISYI